MKNYFRCRSSSTQVLLGLVLFTAGGCLVVKAALFRPEATNTGPKKTLTFADRVVYQYAIEEVYWRHRIWPKENPGLKPPLDSIVSRREIEDKVEGSLRKSELVADQRGGPISGNELQAEVDRMAAHTKQPDVLRELFAALGNDPFIIAECLARPILADRLVTNRAVAAGVPPARNSFAADTAASTVKDSALYTLPEISVPLDCVDDTWTPTTLTNAPTARYYHTAVWTGSEMIVWGGSFNDGTWHYLSNGGRYDPSTDSWTTTRDTGSPSGRDRHTAVWTGIEMIVWGGYIGFSVNTGGRYNPITDSWTATDTGSAPTVRFLHAAVWTGSEMIVWGGTPGGTSSLNTGGRYNPSNDTWIATSLTNAPAARSGHSAVWTGSQIVVWGGSPTGGGTYFNTGGRYNPTTDSWTATSLANAPAAHFFHTAVWTGSEMILWGGYPFGAGEGARYTPGTDSWVATAPNAPLLRYNHTAVWTGSEMIIWGGEVENGPFNTGGRYNPSTNTWVATNTSNATDARTHHTAVWTGREMIVWGGGGCCSFLNTGGRYCAQPSAPFVQSAASRKPHSDVGTFDVNLPLSGTPGIECRAGGATNDYTMVVTFLANVSVIGSPQAAVTAGSGTVGNGGMSNGGMVTISGNVVTIPLTNVANVQTIHVTLNSVNGSTNVVIPMSILIGDTTGNGNVNAGDVSQTKSRIGQATDQTNFRSDVNTNGSINATDVSIVKLSLGTGLP